VDQVAQFFQALSENVMVKQFEPKKYVAQKDGDCARQLAGRGYHPNQS
jgi:hypothetical protein